MASWRRLSTAYMATCRPPLSQCDDIHRCHLRSRNFMASWRRLSTAYMATCRPPLSLMYA